MKSTRLYMGWICLLAICCSLMFTPPPVTAASTPQSESKSPPFLLYMPFVSSGCANPVLLSPANGAVVDTLLPVFNWDTGRQEVGLKACLSLSTLPNTPSCNTFTYALVSNKSTRTYMTLENLMPETTYFWRVGVMPLHIDAPCHWSQEWSFTTGAVSTTLPPSPQLLAPPNNSVLPPRNVVLSWKPVSGAAGYTVSLKSVDGLTTIHSYLDASKTSDIIAEGILDPGSTFEWAVQARNTYGYGPVSEPRRFRLSGN